MSSVMPVSLVGNKFVSEYYNTLIENPENITKYYTNDSVMTRGNACFEDEKLNTLQQSTGSESIKVTLAHTNFKAAKLVLSGVNAQPSFGRGILIVVFGTVALKGNENDSPVRQFVQTFFLAPQSESAQSYVVQNDTFYFVVPHQPPQPQTTTNFSPIPTATVSHVVVHHEPTPVQQTSEQRAAPVVPNNQQQQQTTQPTSTTTANNNTPVAQNPTSSQTTTATTPAANTTAPVTENKTQEVKAATNNANNTAQANGSAKNKERSSSRRGGNNNNTANNNTANNNNTATSTTPANNNNNNTTGASSNGVSTSSSSTSATTSAPVKRETPRTPSWAGVVTEGKVVVAADQLAPPPAPLILSKKLSSGEKKSKSNNNSNNNNSKGGNKEKGNDKKGFFKNSDPEKFQGEKEERSIYVSNIPFSSDVTAVKTAFDKFGKIYEVILKENGYAFINFYHSEAAGKALKEQIVLENRKLIVEPRKASKSRDQ